MCRNTYHAISLPFGLLVQSGAVVGWCGVDLLMELFVWIYTHDCPAHDICSDPIPVMARGTVACNWLY